MSYYFLGFHHVLVYCELYFIITPYVILLDLVHAFILKATSGKPPLFYYKQPVSSRFTPLPTIRTTGPDLHTPCTDCRLCFWPLSQRLFSASPGWMPPRWRGPASPRCSGRADGCCTTIAPGGTTEPQSPMTA